MAFKKTIRARTDAMRKNGEPHVTREVTFPNSLTELKAGIGPWKNLKELFDDAKAHRIVVIQNAMRQALLGNGTTVEETEDEEFVEE